MSCGQRRSRRTGKDGVSTSVLVGKNLLAHLENLEPLLVRQLEHVGTAQNETRVFPVRLVRRVLGEATLLLKFTRTPVDEVVERLDSVRRGGDDADFASDGGRGERKVASDCKIKRRPSCQ